MSAVSPEKCSCVKCHCPCERHKAVVRDGKTYCSKTCAYECTEQTCLCVHEGCEDEHHQHDRASPQARPRTIEP